MKNIFLLIALVLFPFSSHAATARKVDADFIQFKGFTSPGTPAASYFRSYIDSADSIPKYINSSATTRSYLMDFGNQTVAGIKTFSSHINLPEISDPSTPASGFGSIYFTSSGVPKVINDAGTASEIRVGTVAVANGGTGQTSYTDGQLLIGNTSGNTLTKATLTAGSGIAITNGNGSISIATSGSGISPSNVYCVGGNGRGGSSSGATTVRNYTTCTTQGSDITYTARTTTTGDLFTVNTTGSYVLTASDARTGGGAAIGFTVDSVDLDADVTNPIPFADGGRCGYNASGAANVPTVISCTLYLTATDVVRVQSNTLINFTNDAVTFSITRIN
jgi:hypothetical protein